MSGMRGKETQEESEKLTIEQEILVSAAADEILESTSIHQLTLVQMLAVAREHDLNAVSLLKDLSVEVQSNTAVDILFLVSELRRGASIEDAMARVPGVVPESVALALAAAQSKGLEKPLSQALLSSGSMKRTQIAHAEDTHIVSKFFGLFQRYVLLVGILAFLIGFVVPQFIEMFEEFEIELPASMELLIQISSEFVKFRVVFPLLLLSLCVFLVIKRPEIFTSYFSRWIPSRWKQPVLSRNAKKDRKLAWMVRTSNDTNEAASRIGRPRKVGVKEEQSAGKKNKAGAKAKVAFESERAVSQKVSDVVWTAASPESASWILQQMSRARESKRHVRSLAGFGLLIWVGDFVLMSLAALVGISVFQSLINIINRLIEYV